MIKKYIWQRGALYVNNVQREIHIKYTFNNLSLIHFSVFSSFFGVDCI